MLIDIRVICKNQNELAECCRLAESINVMFQTIDNIKIPGKREK